MKQHTIILAFDDQGNVVPMNEAGTQKELARNVQNGDQIRWNSAKGKVAIDFKGKSPFAANATGSDEDFKIVSAPNDQYPYTCAITTDDGKKHGWQGDCGGIVIVGGGTRTGGGGG